jgi:hypothetical protein
MSGDWLFGLGLPDVYVLNILHYGNNDSAMGR